MKQFPSAIFGYHRGGKRKDVKYIPNPKVVNDLKSFFYEVTEVIKADDLFNILMKYKKTLKNKKYEELLKYLENLFLCGTYEDFVRL
jgi:site-specific DNA recombinase